MVDFNASTAGDSFLWSFIAQTCKNSEIKNKNAFVLIAHS